MRLIRQGLTVAALLALTVGELLAQRRITGRVTDEATSQPLGSVSITVAGAGTGTYTNEQGTFSLAVPSGAVQLRVRRIGYQLRTVLLQPSQDRVEVALRKDVLQLEGVTVTSAASVVERKNAATAVSQVGAEQLNRVPAVQVDQALQGKIVGANIAMNSGLPGGGAQIQIRGATSMFGNGEPLFVIDGVLMSNAAISNGRNAITQAAPGLSSPTSTQDAPVNRLADLNPNDIENIEVLKGAAASALYGSRATNGVIIITTKRGKSGAPRWAITQRLGAPQLLRTVESRRFPDVASAVASAESQATGSGALVTAAAAANGGTVPFFDYQGQLYGESPLNYETTVSVDGGSENSRYRVSLTNADNPGIARNTGAGRQTARLNFDQNVTSKLTSAFGLSVSRFRADRGLDGNDNTYTSPLYAFGYTPAVIDLRAGSDGAFPENPFAGGGGANTSNPFQTFALLRNREVTNRIQGNSRLDYQALATASHQLRFTAQGGVDRFDQDGEIVSPPSLQFEPGDGLAGTNVQANATSRQYNFSVAGTYNFSPKDLPFSTSTLGGVSVEQQELNVYRIQSRGTVPTIGIVGAGTVAVGQNREFFRDQAFFAQQEVLAFDERLFLSAGLRGDRSSANGPDDWFLFSKAQGSYRFVSPLPRVDEIKLRGAWGQAGNRPTYGLRDLGLAGPSIIGGQNGFTVAGTQGNPDVRPERMTEIEYGVDAQFLNRRLSVQYTRFDRKIKDALLPLNVAPTLGYSSFFGNGMNMSSVGNEVDVSASVLQRKGFTWVSRVTFFNVDERVDALPVPRFFLGSSGFGASFGRTRIGAGLPVDNIWGRQMMYIPVLDASGNRIQVGGRDSVTLQRVDTLMQEATPRYTMSFFNDFTVGRFTLGVQVDYRNGGYLSNLTNTLFDEAQNSRDWDKPSPCRGFVAPTAPTAGVASPCLLPGGAIAGGGATATLGEHRLAQSQAGLATPYVQDGSFVKLREVTLAYAVPTTFSRKLLGNRVSDMRVSLTGRNLLISTPYWGADPEVNNFGNRSVRGFVDLAPFPPSRSFFLNIDLGF